jgi:hypothetical protein
MSGQGFSPDPISILFHLLDHKLKEEGLEIAREQLKLNYLRDERDAAKLRLYQERNAMEWVRFEQAQIQYVFELFNTMPKEQMAFTLRSGSLDNSFAYLMQWLIFGNTPEGWNAERFATLIGDCDFLLWSSSLRFAKITSPFSIDESERNELETTGVLVNQKKRNLIEAYITGDVLDKLNLIEFEINNLNQNTQNFFRIFYKRAEDLFDKDLK